MGIIIKPFILDYFYTFETTMLVHDSFSNVQS